MPSATLERERILQRQSSDFALKHSVSKNRGWLHLLCVIPEVCENGFQR